MYQERPSRLPNVIVWQRVVPAGGDTPRILPDGCLDLIWTDGRLLVAGPDTTAHLVSTAPGSRWAGLRFAPGTGPGLLGVPASELRDQRVPLDRLWPAGLVRDLVDRVGNAADPAVALEAVAAARLCEFTPAHPSVAVIVARLRSGASVAATARAVQVSERELRRRCATAFGYGPKTLARILRVDRAVALARAGTPLATVANRAGYADQAHLSREVKALAGVPLGVLVGRPVR